MKILIFVTLILGSGTYLVVNDSSTVSKWLNQQMPAGKMEAITQALDSHVNNQLAAFKEKVQLDQQQQVETLQQRLNIMEQKYAKLSQQVSAQLATQQTHLVDQEQANGVTVSTVPRQQPFGSAAIENTAENVAAISNPPHMKLKDPAIAQKSTKMDKQQRRKQLQSLSEHMTLTSLGVEK